MPVRDALAGRAPAWSARPGPGRSSPGAARTCSARRPATARRPRCPGGPGRSGCRAGSAWPPSWRCAGSAGVMPSRSATASASANTASCRSIDLVAGRVRVREVAPDADHLDVAVGLRLRRRLDQRGPVGRGGAAAGQAGVDLEVDAGRALRPAGRRRPARRAGPGWRRSGRRRRRRPRAAAGPGASSQASTGAVMPARRSASASSRVATPSQVAPPASAARADGSMPWP